MSEGRKALLLVLIFALLLGGWSLYYNWLYDTEMEKLADSSFNDSQAIRQIDMQIEREQEEREAMEDDYYLIIPKESDLANLHQYVYDVAGKHKLELSSVAINTVPAVGAGKLSQLDLRFGVNGKYTDVRAFMQELYNNQRFLKLDMWSWGGSDNGKLGMELAYQAFYYPNDDENFLDVPKLDTYTPAGKVSPIK